jgi:hypothetical protein
MVKMKWDTLHKEGKKTDIKPQVKEKERRDPFSQGLAERGGVGQGRHKNKQDFDRGHARKPKHPKQERESALTLQTWVKAAEKLLKDHTDHGTSDLYGRAYLRAIIDGNEVQATHLAKRFPSAKQMRQELIDAIY